MNKSSTAGAYEKGYMDSLCHQIFNTDDISTSINNSYSDGKHFSDDFSSEYDKQSNHNYVYDTDDDGRYCSDDFEYHSDFDGTHYSDDFISD